ncbi:hypothetical protein CPB84DRAFT_1765874 [Gymnopilus junonius]|uniref:Uncharacterized protein n=1 Tax=Gymnopilus junonius TaxID=109634 RepID=A0A9P5NZM7_GYMJU|nr:hypothetical protein CPB84DRAFT_1765874 [Gymnopilus junonius]
MLPDVSFLFKLTSTLRGWRRTVLVDALHHTSTFFVCQLLIFLNSRHSSAVRWKLTFVLFTQSDL